MPQNYPLGPYLHLVPLHAGALPAHPSFDASKNPGASAGAQRPEIQPFLKHILDEAHRFITGRVPKIFTQSNSTKSRPADAEVQRSHQTISVDDLRGSDRDKATQNPRDYQEWPAAPEKWFARFSKHYNEASRGTATWEEFFKGLKQSHSENEADYTPDIYHAHRLLSYDDQTVDLTVGDFHEIKMEIFEMCHKLPPPLNPRCFPVLVISASHGDKSFIVAQTPIDVRDLEQSLYSSGRNVGSSEEHAQRKKKVVLGMYTSIEYCVYDEESKSTEWRMATASDAAGNLPMSLQKMAVPGKIADDVGLFIKWTQGRRGREHSKD